MSMNGGPILQPDYSGVEVAVDRLQRGLWNGKGKPPSREAAIEWAKSRGVPPALIAALIPTKGTLTAAGHAARRAVEQHNENTEREAGGQPSDPLDADVDGTVTATEVAAAGGLEGDDLDAFVEGGPGAAPPSRGLALLPVGATEEQAAALQFDNNSTAGYERFNNARVNDGPSQTAPDKTGVRYYEENLLDPLKWSAEQRADFQRVAHSIGLYGDKPVKLGSWGAQDSAIYQALLTSANVDGLTWHEMLAQWNRNPPQELLDEINGDQPNRPVIRVTNPLDIQQTAQAVSQSLTGEVDPGFTQSTVAPYQGIETAEQNAAYDASLSPEGGTVTQAPSVSAFIEDRLRRENPIEVDGYQFLTQFEQMLSMLGVS